MIIIMICRQLAYWAVWFRLKLTRESLVEINWFGACWKIEKFPTINHSPLLHWAADNSLVRLYNLESKIVWTISSKSIQKAHCERLNDSGSEILNGQPSVTINSHYTTIGERIVWQVLLTSESEVPWSISYDGLSFRALSNGHLRHLSSLLPELLLGPMVINHRWDDCVHLQFRKSNIQPTSGRSEL